VRLRLRYKPVGEDQSVLVQRDVAAEPMATGGEDATRWAAVIAGFGMLLRDSGYAGTLDWPQLLAMARPLVGDDADGRRAEALRLMAAAAALRDATAATAR